MADPVEEPRAVASTRSVDIAVALLLLAFAGLMAFDNWKSGAGWASDGPKSGYFLFCLLTQWLGIYVASFFLVAGFMRFVGGIAWWKSLLTSFLFAAAMFVTFDVAFDVIMPKGPLEALLGF